MSTPVSDTVLPMKGSTKAHRSSGLSRKTITLLAFACLSGLALVLGLSLGLGLKHSDNNTAASSMTSSTPVVPTVISPDQLVNASQFYLDPSWNINAGPTVRDYNWTISEIISQPGGISKPMIAVNGQSPGPLVEANLGDRIVVNVVNQMSNATAIHWHGQFQNGTNFYDGTFGITQCGIPPNGGQMTYDFTVQNVGTYWYHAHFSTQYTDGLYGALILHSPDETAIKTIPYDEEVVVMLGDFYNTYSSILTSRYLRFGTGINGQPGNEPAPDGSVMNGVSQATCAYTPATDSVMPERRRGIDVRPPLISRDQAVVPENITCNDNATLRYPGFTLESNKTYRIRIINIGTFVPTQFSIDGHVLTAVEADGTSIEPMQVQSVTVAVAQRYSVIVKMDQKPGAYWIRAGIQTDQLTYTGPDLNSTTFGVLRYNGTNSTAFPTYADAPTPSGFPTQTIDLFTPLVPADKMDAPASTIQEHVAFSMQYDANGDFRSFFNSTSWAPLTDTATLFESMASPTYSNPSQLTIRTDGIQVLDFVINSYDDGTHPFHLHGYKFWVMGQGEGSYTGQVLNVTNPMRRDTVVIGVYSWIVLRFVTDNPGLWAFHCHISWHMEAGLLLQFENRPDALNTLAIPAALKQACSSS